MVEMAGAGLTDEAGERGSRGEKVGRAEPTELDQAEVGLTESTGVRALVDRSRRRLSTGQARANDLLESYHDRPLLDVGIRIYRRDHESAGTIVGSALALRLFLFFIPLLLFVVGLFGRRCTGGRAS